MRQRKDAPTSTELSIIQKIRGVPRNAQLGGRTLDDAPLVMPCGKYKDWPLTDVPTEYLAYCVKEWDESELYYALEQELWKRPDRDKH